MSVFTTVVRLEVEGREKQTYHFFLVNMDQMGKTCQVFPSLQKLEKVQTLTHHEKLGSHFFHRLNELILLVEQIPQQLMASRPAIIHPY